MWPYDKCGLSPRDKMNRKLKEMSKSPDFSGLNNNIDEEKQEPPSEERMWLSYPEPKVIIIVGK